MELVCSIMGIWKSDMQGLGPTMNARPRPSVQPLRPFLLALQRQFAIVRSLTTYIHFERLSGTLETLPSDSGALQLNLQLECVWPNDASLLDFAFLQSVVHPYLLIHSYECKLSSFPLRRGHCQP